MTDNEEFTEPGPAATEEHADQEAQNESWQEEMPPEDDFHDHDEQAEAEISEDVMPEAEEVTETSPQTKKSGTGVMVAVLAGMAVFIGVLAYSQFSGGESSRGPVAVPASVASSKKETAPSNDQAILDKKAQASSEAGFTNLPVTPTTSEADITAIYNTGLSKTTAANANAVAIPGVSSPDHTADKMAVNKGASTDIVTMTPTVVTNTANNVGSSEVSLEQKKPQAEGTKSSALSSSQAAIPPAAVLQAVPSAQGIVTSDIDARFTALSAQLDELRKTLQETSQQTAQLAARLDNNQTSSTPANVNVTTLENRLDQLEKKLSQVEPKSGINVSAKGATTTLLKEPSQEIEDTGLMSFTEPAKDKDTDTVRKKQVAKKTTKHKTSSKQAHRSEKSGKEKQKRWVLRAATPDAAWVSKGADVPELQQVHVGDTLPGIGKIRAIQQTGKSWEIVGTRGSIR